MPDELPPPVPDDPPVVAWVTPVLPVVEVVLVAPEVEDVDEVVEAWVLPDELVEALAVEAVLVEEAVLEDEPAGVAQEPPWQVSPLQQPLVVAHAPPAVVHAGAVWHRPDWQVLPEQQSTSFWQY